MLRMRLYLIRSQLNSGVRWAKLGEKKPLLFTGRCIEAVLRTG
jgi:hypothetical protein